MTNRGLKTSLQIYRQSCKSFSAYHLGRDFEAEDCIHGHPVVSRQQAEAKLLYSDRQVGEKALEKEEPSLIIVELDTQPSKDSRIDEKVLGTIRRGHPMSFRPLATR